MLQLRYHLQTFEDINHAKPKFFNNMQCIVDNELGNNIAPEWDYTKGFVVVTGFLHDDYIKIFVREDKTDPLFHKKVKMMLDKHKDRLWSFNAEMEQGNFKGMLGKTYKINEIKPFKAKGWNKDKFYETLRKRKRIRNVQPKDIFQGDSRLCEIRWKQYTKDKDIQHLMDIVSHNINCLLKESLIQREIDYFKDNWILDENSFMMREKE